jgi:uncharacterized SAM-binding protein YcdF (DUF218 family)
MPVQHKIYKSIRAKRSISFMVILLLVSFSVWVCGFFLFIYMMPNKGIKINQTTDAVVVLTGGSARLKKGLKLLTEKKAKKLFVSGVYRGNDVKHLLQIQKHNPSEILCCINLGYKATSTVGNAVETANWIKKHNYSSLQLVTANYHMPRSLMLFRETMPNIRIIPNAVSPSQFKRTRWWSSPRTLTLILSEYLKYIIASINLKLRYLWQFLRNGS